jgi:hypothetical protein
VPASCLRGLSVSAGAWPRLALARMRPRLNVAVEARPARWTHVLTPRTPVTSLQASRRRRTTMVEPMRPVARLRISVPTSRRSGLALQGLWLRADVPEAARLTPQSADPERARKRLLRDGARTHRSDQRRQPCRRTHRSERWALPKHDRPSSKGKSVHAGYCEDRGDDRRGDSPPARSGPSPTWRRCRPLRGNGERLPASQHPTRAATSRWRKRRPFEEGLTCS